MVPLYGRGQNPKDAKIIGGKTSAVIPPRPAACGVGALVSPSRSQSSGQQLLYRQPYQNNPNLGGAPYDVHTEEASSSPLSVTGLHHSTVGMFGEMFIARVLGNSESLYGYRNSYRLMGGSSSRLRRQEQQADESLRRISFFLLCCFLLCLIVF